MSRVAIIGDVHGHLDELVKLLATIEEHQVDRCILLGDLVDRGPDSFGCVELARTRTFRARSGRRRPLEVVRGNHEDSYCRAWLGVSKPGDTGPCRPGSEGILKGLTRDEVAWMWSRPYKLTVPELGLLLVHGGIAPSMREDHQVDERVMRTRYLHEKTGASLSGFEFSTKFWADDYDGRFGFVVYGHESFRRPNVKKWSLGLDGEGRGFMHAAIFSNEYKNRAVRFTTFTVEHPPRFSSYRFTSTKTEPAYESMFAPEQLGLPW